MATKTLEAGEGVCSEVILDHVQEILGVFCAATAGKAGCAVLRGKECVGGRTVRIERRQIETRFPQAGVNDPVDLPIVS